MKFNVSGKVRIKGNERTFIKEVEAKSENDAKEKILALFGSDNGLQRSMVNIEKVEKAEG